MGAGLGGPASGGGVATFGSVIVGTADSARSGAAAGARARVGATALVAIAVGAVTVWVRAAEMLGLNRESPL